jgi:hypothetical protein
MTFIDVHKKDFLDCVNIIEKRMLKNLRDHPINFIDFMCNSLNETSNLNEFNEELSGPNNRARKAHDFYGWMAKDDAWGACRGSLYRSENYMNIPLEKRSGKRKDRVEGFCIHIEHTIPVNVILKSIWHSRETFRYIANDQMLQKKLYETFLSLSVCTAVTWEEEKACVPKEYRDEHPDFVDGQLLNKDSLNEVLPFQRYNFENGLRLFEVINGTEISPDKWSLKDHSELMSKVNIYEWNYVSTLSCF